jgi:bifunctional non-homologous end joining protein LigD
MGVTRISEPLDHPDFLFELKHDGFRSLAYVSDGHCELVSRKLNHYKSFDSLKTALAHLAADAVLDGELAAWTVTATANSTSFCTVARSLRFTYLICSS